MGRSRTEDNTGRDVGLIGEKHEAIHNYEHSGAGAVDAMLRGEHPTTFVGTVECATRSGMGRHHTGKDGKHIATHGGHEAHEKSGMAHMKSGGEGHPHHTREMERTIKGGKEGGKMPKFAAGGVGKVRKGQY